MGPRPGLVFANTDPQDPHIPDAVDVDASAALRRARAYQIAAAHFYAQHFDLAEHLFGEIALDRTSEYWEIAPYLRARALIRKGTLAGALGDFDRTALVRAKAILTEVSEDEARSGLRRPAIELSYFIDRKLERPKLARELGRWVVIGRPSC